MFDFSALASFTGVAMPELFSAITKQTNQQLVSLDILNDGSPYTARGELKFYASVTLFHTEKGLTPVKLRVIQKNSGIDWEVLQRGEVVATQSTALYALESALELVKSYPYSLDSVMDMQNIAS